MLEDEGNGNQGRQRHAGKDANADQLRPHVVVGRRAFPPPPARLTRRPPARRPRRPGRHAGRGSSCSGSRGGCGRAHPHPRHQVRRRPPLPPARWRSGCCAAGSGCPDGPPPVCLCWAFCQSPGAGLATEPNRPPPRQLVSYRSHHTSKSGRIGAETGAILCQSKRAPPEPRRPQPALSAATGCPPPPAAQTGRCSPRYSPHPAAAQSAAPHNWPPPSAPRRCTWKRPGPAACPGSSRCHRLH